MLRRLAHPVQGGAQGWAAGSRCSAGPIFAGVPILRFHGIANAATVLGMISVLGLLASFFIRETRGQPLPD